MPAWEQRVLGLYRLWSTGAYLYPYLDAIAAEWDGLLREYLPVVVAATSALDYHRAVAGALTVMRDSHGATTSTVLAEHTGTHWPSDIVVDEVDGRAVAVHVGKDVPTVRPGDEVLAVDGELVTARLEGYRALFPASTPQWLAYRTHRRLLDGPEGSTAELTMLSADGTTYQVGLPRCATTRPQIPPTLATIERLDAHTVYLDLGRLEPGQVTEAVTVMREARVAVLDLRTYPRATGVMLAAAMTDRPVPMARTWWREPRLPRRAQQVCWQPGEAEQVITHTVLPSGDVPLTCRLIVIVDRGCISQGEHTALALAAVADTTFVGEPTAGADGNVVLLELPGGIGTTFTGLGVSWPDGRPLQRVGILPDVAANRTQDGIRAGRDELLEAALRLAEDLGGS